MAAASRDFRGLAGCRGGDVGLDIGLGIAVGCGCDAELFGGVDAKGDDLRAALAGGFALLKEPAAGGTDATGGKRGVDCGHELDETGSESAVGAVEMRAGALLAGGREAEDLCWRNRCRHGEQFVGDWDRFFNPRNARLFRIRRIWQHDSEGHASRHGGLRAGAKRDWLVRVH